MARGLLFHSTLCPWNTCLSLHAAADHHYFPCLADTPQFLHPHYCRWVFRLVSTSGYYKSVLLESSCTFVRVSLDDWFSNRCGLRNHTEPHPPQHIWSRGPLGRGPTTCMSDELPSAAADASPRTTLWEPPCVRNSATMGTSYICAVQLAAASRSGVLSTWKLAYSTGELNFSVL